MTPTHIALHHSLTPDSGTVSWDAIRRYHKSKGWRDIGYHFGIEDIGGQYEILTGRMMTETGAHCIGLNQHSLGIVFVGDFDNHAPPDEQWKLGVRLVKSLITVFNIPVSSIIGHRDRADKTCPGRCFDMAKFRNEL